MNILKLLIMVVMGIILIVAGIKGWKCPTTHWHLRKTKFGEILNSIVWVLSGVVIIMTAFDIFIF